MSRRTFRRIIPLILVLGLITAGCFQIRRIGLAPATLDTGETGRALIFFYPLSHAEMSIEDYPFILIGWEDDELNIDRVSALDRQGNFGGPFGKVNDLDVVTLARTSPNCEANGLDAADVTGMSRWRAWRTSSEVDSTSGDPDDKFVISIKWTYLNSGDGSSLPSTDDDRANFVIFSGHWSDIDDNGDVDPGEIVCTGMVFSSISETTDPAAP